MKLPIRRHSAIAVCSLGISLLLMGCGLVTVSWDTSEPDTSQPPKADSTVVSPESITSAEVVNSPKNQNQAVKSKTKPEASLITYTSHPITSKEPLLGTLRMSNQTDQPVRLALLARRIPKETSSSKQTEYNIPAHWDFAPKEGGEQGLVLSLPDGNLKLEKGDILVAFAQDGSRHYWGPYVAGETQLPTWDHKKREWDLVLNP